MNAVLTAWSAVHNPRGARLTSRPPRRQGLAARPARDEIAAVRAGALGVASIGARFRIVRNLRPSTMKGHELEQPPSGPAGISIADGS